MLHYRKNDSFFSNSYNLLDFQFQSDSLGATHLKFFQYKEFIKKPTVTDHLQLSFSSQMNQLFSFWNI